MMLSGYNGYILRGNLKVNSATKESIDEAFCRKYLGGAGLSGKESRGLNIIYLTAFTSLLKAEDKTT